MARDRRREINNLPGEIWTEEDDVLLAKTVLYYVKQGDTVVEACREMERKTNGRRTASASKHRWFTRLVDRYKAGYELAKREGKEVRRKSKKRLNQGKRYEEVFKDAFREDVYVDEKEITADDFIELAKKFKDQQNNKTSRQNELQNEIKELRRENDKLRKKNKELTEELSETIELLNLKKKDYENVLNALKVLRNTGIKINIPEPEKPKYRINKDGTIDTMGVFS